jgi:hypothetical protein
LWDRHDRFALLTRASRLAGGVGWQEMQRRHIIGDLLSPLARYEHDVLRER